MRMRIGRPERLEGLERREAVSRVSLAPQVPQVTSRISLLARVSLALSLLLAPLALFADGAAPLTDGEVWNEGVDFYRAGDVTNALRVLKPLMLSQTHGARAAEVVAKLAYDAGDLEEAAAAAQLALRAAPDDAKANRNFTRATDRLPEVRETKRINDVLKAAQGKDPGAILHAATKEARQLFAASATYRTNAPAARVALADRLAAQADRLADAWIPVRQAIAQSVTNEEQAATVVLQVEQAEAKTKKAATALGDLDEAAYATLSDVEHDFTRFLKQAILPPAAMDEDLVAQSNAWLDVEAFNGRAWQKDALDYTRAFRAKFPAWARAYEQQAQSDTNRPPFTAEDQAKVAALATELEKLQLGSVEKPLPPDQEKALAVIEQIRALLPKDPNGGGGQSQRQNQNQQNQQQNQQKQDPQKDQEQQQQDQKPQETDQRQDQDPQKDQEPEAAEDEAEPEESKEDQELEATLKKAQERNDEHEADKKARMRKAPLPPNERDW